MKRIKLLVFIGALFWLGEAHAQGVNLRLDSNSLAALPSEVHLNSSYTVSIIIYNDSTTTFHGDINFGGTVNGDSLVADTSTSSVLQYPTAGVAESIPGHGSIVRSLIINVQNPPFIIGTSGVVIWPKASNSTNPFVFISDTLSRYVTVLYPLGVREISERNLRVYLNGQHLILADDGNYFLKNIKLYDVSGKLLEEQQVSTSGTMDMAQYSAGVYLAEVNFADNTRMIFKVFNAR